MKQIPCYIPSHLRAGKITTPSILPACAYPILAVDESQARKYEKRHSKIEVLAVPERYRGIGRTRAFICKTALKCGHDVIACLDDDITGWLWKRQPSEMGTVGRASLKTVNSRWKRIIRWARELNDERRGLAVNFPFRFALAMPTTAKRLKIGLVNECWIANRKALETAQFTLPLAEDQEATLRWLLDGVLCGQDVRLGHKGPKTSLTSETGGCGDYRGQHPEDWHYRTHKMLQKLFPEYVTNVTKLENNRVGTRVHYKKAAEAGGVEAI